MLKRKKVIPKSKKKKATAHKKASIIQVVRTKSPEKADETESDLQDDE